MRKKTKITIFFTYLLLIIILVIRLFLIYKSEVINTDNFTDYYQKEEADNGGLEITDSNFITFVKEYKFTKKVAEKPKLEEKKIEPVEMLTYKVVSGDSLNKISKKTGVSVDTLKIHNSSIRNGKLKVNQKLTFPSKNGIIYKIKKGDSLSRVARKYGIKTSSIIKNNSIEPRRLKIGQKIFLPNVSYRKILQLENYKKVSEEPKQSSKIEKSKEKKESQKKGSRKSLGFAMPIKYRGVASRFGNRFHPVLKRYILHTGVDLVAKYVPLRASKDGRVTYAGYMGGYGKIIIIKHANNYETRYAHLSVISTKVGERVKQGEFIGKTGKTGRVTGPHLHFEIRYKGVPKNPMKYL